MQAGPLLFCRQKDEYEGALQLSLLACHHLLALVAGRDV